MVGRTLSTQLPQLEGRQANLAGWVHRIRDLGRVRFLILRDRCGLSQVVVPPEIDISRFGCESVVAVRGTVQREPRAPSGVELLAERIDIISPADTPPLEVFKPPAASKLRLETLLDNRAVSLRIPEVLDIFRVQAEILRAFRSHMNSQGFVEIKTPKLVLAGAEGGSALFEVDYFDQ